MTKYVDGFVITMPKENLEKYKKMAELGGKMWMKYGALSYFECVGEDLDSSKQYGALPFREMTKAKENEVIIFSFIVYKSRAHRDEVNSKVMSDPEMNPEDMKDMPFEMSKAAIGGFESFVDF